MLVCITAVLINGCNVLTIPTLVSKDISMEVILVNNLQDKNAYFQEITVDLSNFISDDQFNAIDNIEFKTFKLTLTNFKNTVTNNEDLEATVAFYKLKECIPFTQESTGPGEAYGAVSNLLLINDQWIFENGKESNFLVVNGDDLKDLINDKKIKVGIVIAIRGESVAFDGFHNPNRRAPKFNDNSFSFVL